jgi:hypothetical protein
MTIAKIAKKIQVQIHQFSGKLSRGLPKVARRFIEEMVYGIQTRGSVRLSEVARSLNEGIALKKTINRLSQQLRRPGLLEHIEEGLMREGARRVEKETLLVVDVSDITKPYAEKMEYMATVRDGSNKVLGDGYWTMQVVGVESGEQEITPLYHELYSQNSPEFISENQEIMKAIERVGGHVEGRGIWVIDRGGDRGKLFTYFLDNEKRFIIRLVGDRNVVYRGTEVLAVTLAERCPLVYSERVVKEEKGEEKAYSVSYGFRKVRLPGRKEHLYMVVVKGFGSKPMMLLTTEEVRKNRRRLWWFVEAYITRWRIEETIRFIKQSYQLEDIRVLTYDRLRNMMGLVLAASYFAAVYLGVRAKMEILVTHVLKASKRIFGIPDFRYYAIADGIRELLHRYDKGILKDSVCAPHRKQLRLFDP